jgi:hypothetical protein
MNAARVVQIGLGMVALAAVSGFATAASAREVHVWEKVEITLDADGRYANAYTDVTVWVDLEGPGFRKRCYGFWDGEDVWRVCVAATAPGTWRWRSGSKPADAGLAGRGGQFHAVHWTQAEKAANPLRRGFIRATANGHAFEHADGTPFFLMGDTWWATATLRYPWFDDDAPRPVGPKAGFKDYVRYRSKQEYNAIAMIAAFPHWHNDGKPRGIKMKDGTVIRAAWGQAGTGSAKTMTDEAGRRPFRFPGKVPGYEQVVPDLERINPAYFKGLDRKVDYLNLRGMVAFIEVARRDIGQVWRRYYPWPESYTRYIQYVWSRYQANACLLSPIHFDTPHQSIPAEQWNRAANAVIDTCGPPPFGSPCGTNSNPSSLRNWGHTDVARWLTFHQVGNRRTHDLYEHLTAIFRADPPVPGLNGEPYYDGMLDADPGSAKAALYCRSAMYGSVLSGGLAGHIYGAGGWQGGMWSGEVEPESKWPIWDVIRWPSADDMRHLKHFILSEGKRYQDLVPQAELVSPSRKGKPNACIGWAYAARTDDRALAMLYFERDCPRATVSGLVPNAAYRARWWDPREGGWSDTGGGTLESDAAGRAALPPFPDGNGPSRNDWALKLTKA